MIVRPLNRECRKLEKAFETALILGYITIWYGSHREKPLRVCDGKAALKVKYRKRFKLIQGMIEERYEGRGSDDAEVYSFVFVPKRGQS